MLSYTLCQCFSEACFIPAAADGRLQQAPVGTNAVSDQIENLQSHVNALIYLILKEEEDYAIV